MSPGIGSHHSSRNETDSWITPRAIIDALGPFDLDPCACIPQPWPCAARYYDVNTNGLIQPWAGRVWLNPPYGRRCAQWLARLAAHGNGIALVFARTETVMFFEHVWPKCHALLFIEGRISFHRPDGTIGCGNSGGPSVLIAYGKENAKALKTCGIDGAYVVGPATKEAV